MRRVYHILHLTLESLGLIEDGRVGTGALYMFLSVAFLPRGVCSSEGPPPLHL